LPILEPTNEPSQPTPSWRRFNATIRYPFRVWAAALFFFSFLCPFFSFGLAPLPSTEREETSFHSEAVTLSTDAAIPIYLRIQSGNPWMIRVHLKGAPQRFKTEDTQVWVRLGHGEKIENLGMRKVSSNEWELSLQRPPGFYWYKPYAVINGREIWEDPSFQNHWVRVDSDGFHRIFVAFVREFGKSFDKSGTFDYLTAYLEKIDPIGQRFDTVQLLPIFPVDWDPDGNPQSPFAPLDYFMIEPGLAAVETVSVEELRQIARTTQEERGPPEPYLSGYIQYEAHRRFQRDPQLSEKQWKSRVRLEQEIALARFRRFIQQQKKSGRKVMLDIPAHVGRESVISAMHPDWLIHDGNGDAVIPGTGGTLWKDLAMFDFKKREVRHYFKEALLYWIGIGVEGFRLDWAHGLPLDFVKELREEFPGVYFLAEQLSERETEAIGELMRQGGMNAVYNSSWLMAWDVMGEMARIHGGDPFIMEFSIRATHDSRRMGVGWEGNLDPQVFEGILAAQILGIPDPMGVLFGSLELARQKPQLVGIYPLFEMEKEILSMEARGRLLALLDLRAREPLFGERGNWAPLQVTEAEKIVDGIIAFTRKGEGKDFVIVINLGMEVREFNGSYHGITVRGHLAPGRVFVKEIPVVSNTLVFQTTPETALQAL